MDAAAWGFTGVALGSFVTLAGTVTTALINRGQSKRSRNITVQQERRKQTAEVYEQAIAFLINFGTAINQAGVALNREYVSEVHLARIRLYATDEIQESYFACFERLRATRNPDQVPTVASRMKQHLDALDAEMMS